MPKLLYQFAVPPILSIGIASIGYIVGWTLAGLIVGGLVGTGFAAALAIHDSRRLEQVAHSMLQEAQVEENLVFDSGTADEIEMLARAIDGYIEESKSRGARERREHTRQVQLLDRMQDGLMRIDASGVVTYANVAAGAMFGGRNPVERSFLAVTHDHELNSLLIDCLSSGIEQQMTVDTPVMGRVINVVLVRISEEPADVLAVLRDITELTRLQTLRRDFVANVSHELRTPLSTIKILTETLLSICNDLDQQRFLQNIDNEVDEMTALVDELLLLARLQSQASDINLTSVSALDILMKVQNRTLPRAEQKGIELEIVCPDPLSLAVEVDERQILQAMLNLVHNAINHTQSGGIVVVSAKECTEEVRFIVSDTGTGILPEDMPRIWERFYKTDRSRSDAGTGLGLAIVKHIVLAHGGEVSATSSMGEGSSFQFTIPRERTVSPGRRVHSLGSAT